MIYAQIKRGRKLHLAMQPGDPFKGQLVPAGHISPPICGTPWPGRYRMTINVPLGHACKKCRQALNRVGR